MRLARLSPNADNLRGAGTFISDRTPHNQRLVCPESRRLLAGGSPVVVTASSRPTSRLMEGARGGDGGVMGERWRHLSG
jgi:hypothetical protein